MMPKKSIYIKNTKFMATFETEKTQNCTKNFLRETVSKLISAITYTFLHLLKS
jgi:hypothetical protein